LIEPPRLREEGHNANNSIVTLIPIVTAIVGMTACIDNDPTRVADVPAVEAPAFAVAPAPPPGVVNVSFGGSNLQIWPFTGTDIAGTQADPMNLLFTGKADVVSLRAALFALDGNRTAFGLPFAPPFNCIWSDAFGDIQTTYSDGDGWVANPVQLQCGNYDPVRIHLRLFPAGAWVAGGAHFELLIPQTTEHEVLSWEIAELVVKIDLLRTGLLSAAPGAAPINPAPSFRAIRAQIYNALPPELIALLTAFHGPQPAQPVNADVPIPSDGLASILALGARQPVVAGSANAEFTITFDQVFGRPFCARGPFDIVLVQGPIDFNLQVSVNAAGNLSSHGSASGEVMVTPIDPMTMLPSGAPFRALIRNTHITGVGPQGANVNAIVERLALPPSKEGHGSFMTNLVTSPNGGAHYRKRERC
jgi:hypothetical protein